MGRRVRAAAGAAVAGGAAQQSAHVSAAAESVEHVLACAQCARRLGCPRRGHMQALTPPPRRHLCPQGVQTHPRGVHHGPRRPHAAGHQGPSQQPSESGGVGPNPKVPRPRTPPGGKGERPPRRGLKDGGLRLEGTAPDPRPAPPASCPASQEMSSEYREYADSFGKVSVARSLARRPAPRLLRALSGDWPSLLEEERPGPLAFSSLLIRPLPSRRFFQRLLPVTSGGLGGWGPHKCCVHWPSFWT